MTEAVAFSTMPEYAALDADTKGYFDNRGLSAKPVLEIAMAEAKAHRELQKHIGVPAEQLLRLPKDLSNDNDMKPVWQRLGAGTKPEDYDLSSVVKFSDGSDELDADVVAALKKEFAEAGVPKAQAARIVKTLRDYAEAETKKDGSEKAVQAQAARAAGEQELAKSWGSNARTNQYLAEQAFEKLGWTKEQIEALDSTIGFAPVRQMLLQIGKGLGEAKFIGGGGGSDKSMTREGAQAEIKTLMSDAEFGKKLVSGDAQALKQWNALHHIAYGAAA